MVQNNTKVPRGLIDQVGCASGVIGVEPPERTAFAEQDRLRVRRMRRVVFAGYHTREDHLRHLNARSGWTRRPR